MKKIIFGWTSSFSLLYIFLVCGCKPPTPKESIVQRLEHAMITIFKKTKGDQNQNTLTFEKHRYSIHDDSKNWFSDFIFDRFFAPKNKWFFFDNKYIAFLPGWTQWRLPLWSFAWTKDQIPDYNHDLRTELNHFVLWPNNFMQIYVAWPLNSLNSSLSIYSQFVITDKDQFLAAWVEHFLVNNNVTLLLTKSEIQDLNLQKVQTLWSIFKTLPAQCKQPPTWKQDVAQNYLTFFNNLIFSFPPKLHPLPLLNKSKFSFFVSVGGLKIPQPISFNYSLKK